MKFLKGSLASKLLEFFEQNPDEELTYSDIAEKFEVTERNVYTTVSRLQQAGLVQSAHVVRLPQKGRA